MTVAAVLLVSFGGRRGGWDTSKNQLLQLHSFVSILMEKQLPEKGFLSLDFYQLTNTGSGPADG